eukprot:COSAG03_NODE_5756_length_1181_cov_3.987985_1_plen_185_part_00
MEKSRSCTTSAVSIVSRRADAPVCVCACVRACERERGGGRQAGRQAGRQQAGRQAGGHAGGQAETHRAALSQCHGARSTAAASRLRLSPRAPLLHPPQPPRPAAGGALFKLVCRFDWGQSDIRTWCRSASFQRPSRGVAPPGRLRCSAKGLALAATSPVRSTRRNPHRRSCGWPRSCRSGLAKP